MDNAQQREAKLIELLSAHFHHRDVQAELRALADAYQSGAWDPWAANTGVAIVRPGLYLAFGSDKTVAQLVEVTMAHTEGFTFEVLNGGWSGEWRTDHMMDAGDGWTPCWVAYVQSPGEKLVGDEEDVIRYIERRLANGYTAPQLVLPKQSAAAASIQMREALLDKELPF